MSSQVQNSTIIKYFNEIKNSNHFEFSKVFLGSKFKTLVQNHEEFPTRKKT